MALTSIKRAVFAKGQAIQDEEWWELCRENPPEGDVTASPFKEGDSITVQTYEDAPHEDSIPFHKRLSSRRYISEYDAETRTATAGADIAALLTVYWYHEERGEGAEQTMGWWARRSTSAVPRFWPTVRKQYQNIRESGVATDD